MYRGMVYRQKYYFIREFDKHMNIRFLDKSFQYHGDRGK